MLRLSQLLPKASNSGVAAVESEAMPLAVLEFQSPTAAVIATPVPPIARSSNMIVTCLVGSLLLIGSTMKVDKLVTSNGVLVSSANDSSVQIFNTSSIVRDIKVHPGMFVSKGQVLATLDPTYAAADLSALTQQEDGYAAQVAQLQAQESGKPYVGDPANPASVLQVQTYNQQEGQYNFTMQDYAQKINELQTQIDGFNAQAAYYRQRLGIASNVETMRKDLQQLQVGSRLDTLSATDERVNIQAELASALSSISTNQRQLASQEAERDGFDQQWRVAISQQLATAINSLVQSQQQLSKAKLNNQLVELTAPQDSVVQSVAPISIGAVLQAGQDLMDLAPINAPLSVEADVDGSESGFVHPGNQVVIKFLTLPVLQYGSAKGTVTSVSPESINPLNTVMAQIQGAPLPGAPQDLYYKVEISLDVLNLHNVPPGFRLVPGMPLQADMVIGKRTVMGYFMSKIVPVAYNAFHEP